MKPAPGTGGAGLGDKLAACATLLPGATSLYYWEGKLEQEYEVQMLFKSDRRRQQALLDTLKQHHLTRRPSCWCYRDGRR